MFRLRRKPPYTQEEVAEQIGQIADLMKMRKATQMVKEIEHFTNSIAVSQEVLQYMLEENTQYGTSRRKTS